MKMFGLENLHLIILTQEETTVQKVKCHGRRELYPDKKCCGSACILSSRQWANICSMLRFSFHNSHNTKNKEDRKVRDSELSAQGQYFSACCAEEWVQGARRRAGRRAGLPWSTSSSPSASRASSSRTRPVIVKLVPYMRVSNPNFQDVLWWTRGGGFVPSGSSCWRTSPIFQTCVYPYNCCIEIHFLKFIDIHCFCSSSL